MLKRYSGDGWPANQQFKYHTEDNTLKEPLSMHPCRVPPQMSSVSHDRCVELAAKDQNDIRAIACECDELSVRVPGQPGRCCRTLQRIMQNAAQAVRTIDCRYWCW